MAAVYELLSFPTTTKDAFSAYPLPEGITNYDPRSSSSDHPSKTPRLADDLDSASASRSRNVPSKFGAGEEQKTGPIEWKIVGIPFEPASLDAFGDECYNTVVRFLRVFLARDSISLPASYESVYTSCRTAVAIAGKGDGLYDNLKMVLERSAGELAKELLNEKQRGIKWIAPFNEICAWFDIKIGLLQSLLSYFDQVYLQERSESSSIRDLAFNIFSDSIFGNPQVFELLQSGIQDWVTWERENRMGHEMRIDISKLLSHLEKHDKYSSAFERFYLDQTTSYYTKESGRTSKAMEADASGFIIHCISRVKEEVQRASDMLPEASCDPIRSAAEKALLENHIQWVAPDGLRPLMESENLSVLADMYNMFVRIGRRGDLLASFKTYVLLTARGIVTDQKRDEEMVERLLNFRSFAEKVLEKAFVDPLPVPLPTGPSTSKKAEVKHVTNKEFAYAMRDAFQEGFKSRRNKPAEMIAKYLDKAMRRGQKETSDADFNVILDRALELYRFTDDKDVFRKYYHRALAKRLLTSRSASDASEISILKRLKEKYDPEFDLGESMFKDISLSRDLAEAYQEHCLKGKGKERGADGPKLSVMVLQQSVWPFSARKQNVDLPPNMLEQVVGFTEFYKKNHKGHVLNWDHSLGNASIKAMFKSGQKELLVSLHQAVVLMLFNDADEISFNDIKAMISMDDGDLRRTLQSLACGKKRVLEKHPMGRDVNDNDKFRYNPDFTYPRYQVRIDSIQAKETPEEAKKAEEGIETDRRYALDAAIVRVMKSRKERLLEQLKSDVVDAVRFHFVPDIKEIKKRVLVLVESEYIRRDENNPDLFLYVA